MPKIVWVKKNLFKKHYCYILVKKKEIWRSRLSKGKKSDEVIRSVRCTEREKVGKSKDDAVIVYLRSGRDEQVSGAPTSQEYSQSVRRTKLTLQ